MNAPEPTTAMHLMSNPHPLPGGPHHTVQSFGATLGAFLTLAYTVTFGSLATGLGYKERSLSSVYPPFALHPLHRPASLVGLHITGSDFRLLFNASTYRGLVKR
jgi:hypothetical protein